ncbi:MAG: hypothetical protein GY868_09600 [Deltaproteobacteria bacterium]|nr:hypothetical protein [Deltaproteobacteria bacterium]
MEGKKITAKELQLAVEQEVTEMVQEVVEAMNNAKAGSIIADSEEQVRDANAKFKQKIYQKALDLLQKKQEAFSPSAEDEKQGNQAGHTPDD